MQRTVVTDSNQLEFQHRSEARCGNSLNGAEFTSASLCEVAPEMSTKGTFVNIEQLLIICERDSVYLRDYIFCYYEIEILEGSYYYFF